MTRNFEPSTPRADAMRAAIPRFRLLPDPVAHPRDIRGDLIDALGLAGDADTDTCDDLADGWDGAA